MKKRYSIKLSGTLTTISPIIHTHGSSGNSTYCIKTSVPFINEMGETEYVEVPYFQGSSFRGKLRRNMAQTLIDAVGGNLDIDTAVRLMVGGKMEAGNYRSLASARDVLERCIDLQLFGGIDGSNFESHLKVGMLYPITNATLARKIVPLAYEYIKVDESRNNPATNKMTNALTEWVIQTRRDELLNHSTQAMSAISEDYYAEAEKYLIDGIERQSEIKASKKDKNATEKPKKTIQAHFGKIEGIAVGVPLYSEIEVSNVSDVAMGLFLKTLEGWLGSPYLGSASRSGYGKVSASYHLKADGKTIRDFVGVDEFGEHTLNYEGFGSDCIKAFDKWVKKATTETIKAS